MSATLIGRPSRAARSRADASGVRADIQALRALAVGLVVVYHFFPGRLPGGFVGVDVFFVISGFLITGHLVGKPPATVRDLAEFWGRRIRRLLPASFLVLAVTLVATLLVAPQTVWENTAKQIAASAAYVQNWFLAFEAVDYLAADAAASPVQHFWSLSIEEQFYFVWPILTLAAAAFAVRRGGGRTRRAVGVVIAVLSAASFVASVWITATDPAAAYFVTWTRVWELGAGGLAACLFPWIQSLIGARGAVRTALAYVGLGGIVLSGVLYSNAMPFPGVAAALPVLSTALVLVAAVGAGRFSPLPVLSLRPVQVAGDLSYSIYLWHWPAVILVPYALGHSMRLWQKILVIIAVVALSWLTKRFVEDRFRGRAPLGNPLRRSFIFAAAGMLVIGGAAAAVIGSVQSAQTAEENRIVQGLQDPASCFGARALASPGECEPHGAELLTSPVFAAEDKPDPYTDGCWVLGDFSDTKTCHYGSDSPDATRVALIGNSHAGHWLPTLQQIGETENWSITTYLISECYTVDIALEFENPTRSANCLAWNEQAIAEIADGGYDLVVISNRTNRLVQGLDEAQSRVEAEAAYGRVLDTWAAADLPVLVLRDTPYAEELGSVPDCVAANLDDLTACDGDRAREQDDPLARAAARSEAPTTELVDLTDRICAAEVCYSVVGGVIVYFDRGHLSATFARSLAPDVRAAADRVIAAAGR